MNKLLLTFIALLFSNVTFAQNINLRCIFPESEKGEVRQFDFVLNEQNSTVLYRVNGKKAFTVKAFFDPEMVTWDDEYLSSFKLKRTINRTTLEYTQTTQIGEYPPESETTKCTIVRPSARRKF